MDGEQARSVAFTGPLAVQLDERQYAAGFGPCLDASVSGGTIVIRDTAADDRYPEFCTVAARAGVGSSLSVGMPVPQRVVGGLNLYAAAGAFDDAAFGELVRRSQRANRKLRDVAADLVAEVSPGPEAGRDSRAR